MNKYLTLFASLLILSLTNQLPAATLFWDGGNSNIATNGDGVSQGTAGTWNTALQNWDQGVGLPHIAWNNANNDDAYFDAPTNRVALGAAVTANSLMFAGTNSGYVVTDGGVAANTLSVNSVSNNYGVTLYANIVNSTGFSLSGSNVLTIVSNSPGFTAPITINSGATLRFGDNNVNNGPTGFGNVSIATNATLNLRDGTSAAYAQTFFGEGSVAILNKNSGTTTTLSGANTHSGKTIVAQATLAVSGIDESGPNNLGYGPLQIGDNSSATALNYIFPGGDVTTSRPLIFGGTVNPAINNNSSGVLTLAGTVSFAANATAAKTISLGGNMFSVFASAIPDNTTPTTTNVTRLFKTGTGAWLLAGSNTFSGGVSFQGGSASGTLMVTNDTGFGAATGSITFTTNGSTAASSGTIAATNFPVTLGGTRTITFTGPNAGGAASGVFVTTDSNSLTVASYITGIGNVKRASSSSTLTGPVRFINDTNNYSGIFSMGYGTLEFTSVANSGTPSSLGQGSTNAGRIDIGNSASAATFKYIGSSSSSTTRAINWQATSGGLTLDASGVGAVQYLATGNLKSGAGSSGLTLAGTNTGNNTLAQVINDSSGTTALAKIGAGRWILTAANSYGGATTISGGTLEVNADANLGTAPVSATPDSLAINNGALAANASFALTANRGIALGPTGTNSSGANATGNGTIDVAAAQTVTYAGIMADRTSTNAGGLIKTGAGQLTLSGANIYTGDTRINGGTLALTGSGTIGSGTNLMVDSGATFDVTGTAGFTLGASQVLHATNGATATLAGNVNASSGAWVLGYTNGTPTVDVINGTFTLSAATVATVNIQNGGIPLPAGSYKLISKGAGGAVDGVAPASVTFGGDGVATNTASLAITSGELYLVVPSGTMVLYPPTLSSIGLSGGATVLNFSGTNGQNYQILTSTDVAAPLTNWTAIGSGTFSGATVSFTNSPASEPKRFYIISSP